MCPPPEPVTAFFEIETDAVLFGGMGIPCTVLEVTSEAMSSTVTMSCTPSDDPPVEVTLTYGSTGHVGPLFQMGEQVLLDYRTDEIFWVNRWFALRIAGEQPWLVAAGVEGSSLDLSDMTFSEFLAQRTLTLTRHEGICAPTSGDCGDQERLLLEIGYYGDSTLVVAPGSGHAGEVVSYRLAAERASHLMGPIQCTDTPADWYDLVIEAVPEG